jgi:hypothetical protein
VISKSYLKEEIFYCLFLYVPCGGICRLDVSLDKILFLVYICIYYISPTFETPPVLPLSEGRSEEGVFTNPFGKGNIQVGQE